MNLNLPTKKPGRGAPIGNTNGAKQNRIVSDTLRRLAAQNPDKLRTACEGMLDKAATSVEAFNAVADRLEGKVPQALTGPDGGPIQFQRVELVVVDLSDVDVEDVEIVTPIPVERPEITDKFSALAHSVRIERRALPPLEQAKHATAGRRAARGRAKLKAGNDT